MNVGVLALQGDYPEHLAAWRRLPKPPDVQPVFTPADLEDVDALMIPGGESTTIARLLEKTGLWNPLGRRVREGFPVLATCAGLIVLAQRLEPSPGGRDPPTLELLDVTVRRNDYGRQRESFEGPVTFAPVGGRSYPGVFIRAPKILQVGPAATVVARLGGEPVGVRQGRVVGLTFHPELSEDPRVHAWFLRTAIAGSQTP